MTPLDLFHRLRRVRLVLRVLAARVARRIAWRDAVRSPGARQALALIALAFLVALCLGWLDRTLALWLKEHDDSAFADVFRVVTLFGRAWPYYLIAGAAAVAYAWSAAQATDDDRRRRLSRNAHRAGFVFWSLAMSGIISQALKFLLGRARPRSFFADGSYGFDPLNFSTDWTSMPSGHTITAVAVALSLTMLWRPIWPAALAFAIAIGLSRIFITVHYAGDVIVGAVVGIVGVAIVRRLYETAGADFFDDRTRMARTT
jgi:membrane-associated phospholipid phosphatase